MASREFFAGERRRGKRCSRFWFMHAAMFRFITGDWFSSLQIFIFVTIVPLGLMFGYVNIRSSEGKSILPSWLLHGTVNFISFLILAIIL